MWLDTLDPTRLATKGFGAEVCAACERRRQALEELGIARDDPERHAKIRDLQRRALGRALAQQNGQVLLEHAPKRLRGRLEPGPEGSAYLAVTDGKHFVLVPGTRDARSRIGQLVDVSRDASGRPCLVEEHHDRVELGLRAAGEKIARQTGMTFLQAIPERFTGRVREGPVSSPYCAVSSGAHFVLVPATPEVLALRGRTVDVARDARLNEHERALLEQIGEREGLNMSEIVRYLLRRYSETRSPKRNG